MYILFFILIQTSLSSNEILFKILKIKDYYSQEINLHIRLVDNLECLKNHNH